MTQKTGRISLTFGDAGENHVGNQMVGKLGPIGSGMKNKHFNERLIESINNDIALKISSLL